MTTLFAKTSPKMDATWLPFTPNRHFKTEHPRVVVAAKGVHYTTQDGRHIYDGASGLWCSAAGHGRTEIADAIYQQLNTLDYSPAFQFGNPLQFEAAERIAALAPGALKKVFFCNSGSEAVDTSLKMALAYHRARGEGHRTVFIGRERSYHGVGFGGISVGGMVANRKVFGAMLPRVDHLAVPFDYAHNAFSHNECPEWGAHFAEELEQRIIPLHDASNIAAVILEPVQGSTGWILPPKGYLKRIREICDKHGILLIFDEIITGFGRLGTTFGANYFDVVPDMMTFAKIVTNGVIPLGGVIASNSIYDTLMQGPAHVNEFMHGYTYSGNAVSCAGAIAMMNLIEREHLFDQAKALGPLIGNKLMALKHLPHVKSIRTLGAAGAIELEAIPGKAGLRGYNSFMHAFDHGLYTRPAGDTLVLAPPFITTQTQLDDMVNLLGQAIIANAKDF
jgi:beta-alanine--pyruvate transaminase